MLLYQLHVTDPEQEPEKLRRNKIKPPRADFVRDEQAQFENKWRQEHPEEHGQEQQQRE